MPNKALLPLSLTNMSEVKNTVTFQGKEWKLVVNRNLSFWHEYLGNLGYYYNVKDFGIDVRLEALHVSRNGTATSIFYYEPNFGEYIQKLLEFCKSRSNISQLDELCHIRAEELMMALERCRVDTNVATFSDFITAYQRFCPSLMTTNSLGREATVLLEKTLQDKGYDTARAAEVVSIITYPEKHSPLFESQQDLCAIGALAQSKRIGPDEIEKSLDAWLHKHAHIPVNFCEAPWSKDDARTQLAAIMSEDCQQKLDSLMQDHARHLEARDRVLKEISDETIDVLAYALQEATYLNEYRKNIFSFVSLQYRPIFEYIVSLGGSSNWRDGFYLTPPEMLALLEGEKINVLALVAKRNIAGAYINAEGAEVLLEEADLRPFKELIDIAEGRRPAASTGEQSVKGSSANRGVVRGIARVILESKDFVKLNRGDILVTTMTSVDFVPIMEKAGAFVTNEGGITSHAAIVAREMNKPCVIGTGKATQIFKDGDVVEVDADHGIVRIIS